MSRRKYSVADDPIVARRIREALDSPLAERPSRPIITGFKGAIDDLEGFHLRPAATKRRHRIPELEGHAS